MNSQDTNKFEMSAAVQRRCEINRIVYKRIKVMGANVFKYKWDSKWKEVDREDQIAIGLYELYSFIVEPENTAFFSILNVLAKSQYVNIQVPASAVKEIFLGNLLKEFLKTEATPTILGELVIAYEMFKKNYR